MPSKERKSKRKQIFFCKKNVYLSKKTFKKRNVSLRGKFSQKMQNSEELPKMANRMRGLHVARFSLLFLFWFGDLKSAKLKTKIVISPCKLSRITKWFQTCLFNEKYQNKKHSFLFLLNPTMICWVAYKISWINLWVRRSKDLS